MSDCSKRHISHLIGIIMTEAVVCIFSGHAVTLKHPTIVGVMGFPKGVFVADISMIDKDQPSVTNSFNILIRELLRYGECKRQISGREHGGEVGIVRLSAIHSSLNRRSILNDCKTYVRESDRVSWCLSVILPPHMKHDGWRTEAVHIAWTNSDI